MKVAPKHGRVEGSAATDLNDLIPSTETVGEYSMSRFLRAGWGRRYCTGNRDAWDGGRVRADKGGSNRSLVEIEVEPGVGISCKRAQGRALFQAQEHCDRR